MVNPIVRGWINYYGRFYKSGLYPSSGASTTISFVGPCGNTSGCAAAHAGRGDGWRASHDANRASSPTGRWACGHEAGRWEPCESRGSRTVLREPGGAIPPGHQHVHTSGPAGCPERHVGVRFLLLDRSPVGTAADCPVWVRVARSLAASRTRHG